MAERTACQEGCIPRTEPAAKLVAKIDRCRGRRETRIPERERTSSAPRASGASGRTRREIYAQLPAEAPAEKKRTDPRPPSQGTCVNQTKSATKGPARLLYDQSRSFRFACSPAKAVRPQLAGKRPRHSFFVFCFFVNKRSREGALQECPPRNIDLAKTLTSRFSM